MSALRCKPGDLAVIVQGHPSARNGNRNIGIFVRVLAANGYVAYQNYGELWSWHVRPLSPGWDFKNQCVAAAGARYTCPDMILRPIRPGEEPESTEESTSLPALTEVTA